MAKSSLALFANSFAVTFQKNGAPQKARHKNGVVMSGKGRFGNRLDLIHRVATLGHKVGADIAFWKTLLQDEAMFLKVVKLVKKVKPKINPKKVYRVTVDYTKPLADMIVAGKYAYVGDEIISEHFPHDARAPEKVEIRLVQLGHVVSIKKIKAELDRLGFRPATLPELLALGAAYPNLQHKFWIAALGSGWQSPGGTVRFTNLDADCHGRHLILNWHISGDRWGPGGRFAAVRK